MILGNGLIANAFNKLSSDELKNNYIVFASGVSNSTEQDANEYKREEQLLRKIILENTKPIIYFSSILVDINDSKYYKHKLMMEEVLKSSSKEYMIFRIPQVVGYGGNKNTIFNFLKTTILLGDEIVTNDLVERALIDIEDLVKVVDYCKYSRGLILLSNIEKIKVVNLCELISKQLNKPLVIKIKPELDICNWNVDNSLVVDDTLRQLNIERTGYTERLVGKYT